MGAFSKTFGMMQQGTLLNQTPVFSSATTASFAENATGTVFTAIATPVDSYSIKAGGDGASFNINTSTGVVTFKNTPDYETKNSYSLTVIATKGSNTSEQTITVTITQLTYAAGTYFVNDLTGNDNNNGLSPSTPWLTVAKVSGFTFTAGKTILFKRGHVWREVLTVHNAGTEGNRITYGAYGGGVRPIIKNSLDCSGLTWSVYSGSIYQATKTGMPAACSAAWTGNMILIRAANLAGVNSAGKFFNDNATNTLYVWMPDSTNPTGVTLELSQSTANVVTCWKNYITIRDIRFAHGGGTYCVIMMYNSTTVDNNFINCEVGPTWKSGLFIGCLGGLVEKNYIHDCWTGLQYPSGITGSGIGVSADTNGTIVRKNWVERCYMGIALNALHKNALIHNNIVLKNYVNGIDCENGVAGFPTQIYNNFVWHKPTGTAGHGIDMQVGTDANVAAKIKNNIVYGDYTGAGTNVQLIAIDVANNADIDINNNYYATAPGYNGSIGAFALTNYATLALWKTALASTNVTGKDANSSIGDPLVVDLINSNFHLQSNSPCINVGVDVGLTEDYEGNPIVGVPDIGAYEWQS